jgi:uncharacterized MAPEG superfamily protein
MTEMFATYYGVASAYAALATLMLVQVLVSDAALVKAGHVPGTPVTGAHESFLFRATRAHANTNENLGLFLLGSLAATSSGASPQWCGLLAWGFAVSRGVHMIAYYADLRLLRSAAFGVGLLCSGGLITLSIIALLTA